MSHLGQKENKSSNKLRGISGNNEIWIQLVLNEDRVMTDRGGLFLLVNSIMVAGYAFTSVYWLRLLLAIAGLIFSFFWFYTAERGRKNLNFFWEKGLDAENGLPEDEKILNIIEKHRESYHWFWKIKSRKILSWVLPLGWGAAWVFVLVKGFVLAN